MNYIEGPVSLAPSVPSASQTYVFVPVEGSKLVCEDAGTTYQPLKHDFSLCFAFRADPEKHAKCIANRVGNRLGDRSSHLRKWSL